MINQMIILYCQVSLVLQLPILSPHKCFFIPSGPSRSLFFFPNPTLSFPSFPHFPPFLLTSLLNLHSANVIFLFLCITVILGNTSLILYCKWNTVCNLLTSVNTPLCIYNILPLAPILCWKSAHNVLLFSLKKWYIVTCDKISYDVGFNFYMNIIPYWIYTFLAPYHLLLYQYCYRITMSQINELYPCYV